MLEGKCNHRIDNLIYVLLHKVILHFWAKHRRQQFGFEGPGLEVQHRNKAETNARTFTHDNIEELIEGQSYLVQSQSDPNHKYRVDIDNYTCDCDGYPSISYCKHICAVQLLFPESIKPRPFVSIYTPPNEKLSPINDDEMTPAPEDDITQAPTTGDTAAIAQISHKLQTLAICICLTPPLIIYSSFWRARVIAWPSFGGNSRRADLTEAQDDTA